MFSAYAVSVHMQTCIAYVCVRMYSYILFNGTSYVGIGCYCDRAWEDF